MGLLGEEEKGENLVISLYLGTLVPFLHHGKDQLCNVRCILVPYSKVDCLTANGVSQPVLLMWLKQ